MSSSIEGLSLGKNIIVGLLEREGEKKKMIVVASKWHINKTEKCVPKEKKGKKKDKEKTISSKNENDEKDKGASLCI